MLATLHATSPICYRWGLNHLSKCLIKQAETELISRNAAGFPLGRVVVGLLLRGHAELGEVLYARLVKKCFWLTAWFPRRTPEMDEAAHRKLLGYASPTSGETTAQYGDRMAGIVALWAAIVQTSPLEAPQSENPSDKSVLARVPPVLRPANGWTWLVRMFSPPLVGLEPTPRLLDTFITLAGPAMLETYPTQFPKLVVALLDHGINEAGFAAKAKPAVVRLSITLEGWRDHGREYQPVAGRALDS